MLFSSSVSVSFDEFVAMFRTQTKELSLDNATSIDSKRSEEGSLLGLDAKIPGGKYDSTLIQEVEQGETGGDGP